MVGIDRRIEDATVGGSKSFSPLLLCWTFNQDIDGEHYIAWIVWYDDPPPPKLF